MLLTIPVWAFSRLISRSIAYLPSAGGSQFGVIVRHLLTNDCNSIVFLFSRQAWERRVVKHRWDVWEGGVMEGSGKEREICNGRSFPWLIRTDNRFWKLADCFSSPQPTAPSTQHQVSWPNRGSQYTCWSTRIAISPIQSSHQFHSTILLDSGFSYLTHESSKAVGQNNKIMLRNWICTPTRTLNITG